MELKLSEGEIAASLYRVSSKVNAAMMGVEYVEPDFVGLAFETQAPWVKLAMRGQSILEKADGRPLSEAAFCLFTLAAPFLIGEDDARETWEKAAPGFRIVWEAIARHLWVLFDCDELNDLPEAEEMWASWATKRLGIKE